MKYESIGGSLLVSETRLGRWTIKPDSEHNDSCRVSFTPNLGKSMIELVNESQALKKTLEAQGKDPYEDPEFWRTFSAYSSSRDIISVESLFEAQNVIEMIEGLSGPIPSWQETIAAIGFEQAYSDSDIEKHPTLKRVFHMKSNKKFSLSIGDAPAETMWLRYEPNGPSWHNFANLNAVTKSHNGSMYMPHWWPQGYEAMDLMALIVERIVRIRTTQRQHIRFKPTEPITHV